MNDTVQSLLSGELTPTVRVLTAVIPAVLLLLWVVGGMVAFAIHCARHGQFCDEEIESRGSTALVGMWLRQCFGWLVRPAVDLVLRLGIPPNAVTILSVLLASGAGISLAAGRFALGGWLFVFAGVCDFLDGRIARRTGQASARGAFLDSVLDRYSDTIVLAGLGWYYRDSWVLAVVLFALIGSTQVPYIRARAEGLRLAMKDVGLMQRTERIVYLGAAVAFSPILEALLVPADPHPPHRLAIAGIVLLAVSTNFTAIQRLLYGLRALGTGVVRAVPRPGERMHAVSSALVGLASDVLLLIVLTVSLSLSGGVATLLAAGAGAFVELLTNRRALGGPDRGARFTVVAVSSALLNGGGVALLLLLPGVGLLVAWLIVRILVTLTWTAPLRRGYVPHGKHIGRFAGGAHV